MMEPWNNWYHCNGNTYGTWLRGDGRGWRARHHREHVEGDYKNPPQRGFYDALYKQSVNLLKKKPVYLTREQVLFAGGVMVQRLLIAEVGLLSLVLDDHHFHLVGRFPDRRPRYYIGLAKQKASYLLVKEFNLESPIWAKRCRCLPIEDRGHQVASVRYDLKHVSRGTLYVWSFKDGAPVVT